MGTMGAAGSKHPSPRPLPSLGDFAIDYQPEVGLCSGSLLCSFALSLSLSWHHCLGKGKDSRAKIMPKTKSCKPSAPNSSNQASSPLLSFSKPISPSHGCSPSPTPRLPVSVEQRAHVHAETARQAAKLAAADCLSIVSSRQLAAMAEANWQPCFSHSYGAAKH